MISLKPFRVLRPSAAKARGFSAPRLDHLSDVELRDLARAHPHSVAAAVVAGPCALQGQVEARSLVRQAEPATYMHRQVKAGMRCTGVVALVDERCFMDGTIRPHRHAGAPVAVESEAQLDSVIVGFDADELVGDLFEREVNDRPLFHVLADDGATHTLWAGTRTEALARAFAAVDRAIVLEGHRRVPIREGTGAVLAMLVPLSQMHARASSCVVSGDAAQALRRRLRTVEGDEPASGEPPAGFADVLWHEQGAGCVRRRVQLPAPHRGADALQACAHGRLQVMLDAWVGAPVASAWRPGVEAGPAALRSADEVAVALPRPSIGELRQLAEEGLRLPAGSTWFEPRIRTGLWMAERAGVATTISE